jgi:hypothetical protein
VYVPYAQDPMPSLYLIVTPSGAAGIDLSRAIRQAVSIERPGQIVDRITDLDTMLAESVAGARFGAWLFGVFGGIAIVLAALTTKLLSDWLYGVTPLDRWTFVVGGLTMIGIALLASYLPARRAARVDPIVTLKAE